MEIHSRSLYTWQAKSTPHPRPIRFGGVADELLAEKEAKLAQAHTQKRQQVVQFLRDNPDHYRLLKLVQELFTQLTADSEVSYQRALSEYNSLGFWKRRHTSHPMRYNFEHKLTVNRLAEHYTPQESGTVFKRVEALETNGLIRLSPEKVDLLPSPRRNSEKPPMLFRQVSVTELGRAILHQLSD